MSITLFSLNSSSETMTSASFSWVMLDLLPLKSKRWLISFMDCVTAFVTSDMSILETISNEFSAAMEPSLKKKTGEKISGSSSVFCILYDQVVFDADGEHHLGDLGSGDFVQGPGAPLPHRH